ncbi:MAG: Rieske 2Fe-2S domain-containing protein [Prochlorococcus sp.]
MTENHKETIEHLTGSLLGWYAICTSKNLKNDSIYFFSLFNEPLALFRDKESKAVCIKDLCTHRAASFRGGEIKENEIICPYHGARYSSESTGKNPDKVTCQYIVDARYANYAKRTHLYQYPCLEEGDYIYVYYTGKAKVDLDLFEIKSPLDSLVLDSHGFGLSEYAFEEALLDFKCDWSRIIENHLDILHIFWMHGASLPGNDVGRHSIASFDQKTKHTKYSLQTKYFHKDKEDEEFITQTFIPPGRIVMYRGSPESARYVQVLDHIPMANNRARVIVRHYRKFFRNQTLCRAMLFKPLQIKTFYRIFSEDYLVLMTQTFNEQMGYMKGDSLRLLGEDRTIKMFWDWHEKTLNKDSPWDIHPLTPEVNEVHQELLMVYPPENKRLVNNLNRVIFRRVLLRLVVVLLVLLAIVLAVTSLFRS